MTEPVGDTRRATHITFAAAVAEFGLLLRDPDADSSQWSQLLDRIRRPGVAAGDRDRLAFVELVELAASLRQLGR